MNHEIFNNYVVEKEEELWRKLHSHLEEAKKKEVKCGCPSCRREKIGAEDAWLDEAYRIFGTEYPVDHEEEWIADHALKTLYERKPNLKE